MKNLRLSFLLAAAAVVASAQNPMVRDFTCQDAGSTDSYACNFAVAPSGYVTGQQYRFKANTANTLAATINFNSLGTKTIKKVQGGITNDLATGDICVGLWVDLTYDGTNMQMMSPACTSVGGTGTIASTTAVLKGDNAGAAIAATPGTDYSHPSTTETRTNLNLDAEGSGNNITLPMKIWLEAGGCQNTTASLMWDTPTTNAAVAACITGTNVQKGVAEFADGSNLSMQRTLVLPFDYASVPGIDLKFFWTSPTTTGDVVWQAATVCTADAETDDSAFNTASTVTDTTKGTTLQLNTASIFGITTTGCAGGELMHLKVFRDSAHASDTMAGTARLIGIEMTIRRQM